MSAYAHRQHAQADEHRDRDQHGVNPEKRRRLTRPGFAVPRAIVLDDGHREARPDQDVEGSRGNEEAGRISRDHPTIPSHAQECP